MKKIKLLASGFGMALTIALGLILIGRRPAAIKAAEPDLCQQYQQEAVSFFEAAKEDMGGNYKEHASADASISIAASQLYQNCKSKK